MYSTVYNISYSISYSIIVYNMIYDIIYNIICGGYIYDMYETQQKTLFFFFNFNTLHCLRPLHRILLLLPRRVLRPTSARRGPIF